MAEISVLTHGYGDEITTVSTSLSYKPGETRLILHPTLGLQEYVYIRNTAGSALALGLGVMFKNGANDFLQTSLSGAACSRPRFVGIAQWAIADNSYAWVLRRGQGAFKASAAAIGANASVKPVANGLFTDGVVGTDDLVGFCGIAAAAAATTVGYIAG